MSDQRIGLSGFLRQNGGIIPHTTPYEAMYGQAPPFHLPYLLGDSKVEAVDKSLQAREATINLLKFHL